MPASGITTEVENRITALQIGIYTVAARLAKINSCHISSGPQGGQFCETGGGGSLDPGGTISHSIDRNFKYEGDDPTTVWLNSKREEDIRVVDDYLASKSRGKAVGEYSDGKFRVVITNSSQVLAFKEGDPTPVPAGLWMNWPEKSWGISDKKWASMPRDVRAGMEAKEQVQYLPREYEMLKQQFYNPKQR